MKFVNRQYFGNLGGICHLLGNFCLLIKGLILSILADQAFDLNVLLIQWPATLSGFIFLFTASMLLLYGHLTKGFVLSYGLALIGYAILGGDAIMHEGTTATFIGIGIGIGSSLYVLAAAQNTGTRFLSFNTNYLNRKLKNIWRKSLERFPFWPSGVIEFVADSALLTGAVLTGDGAMIIIASLWAVGSVFLGSATPLLLNK